MNPTDMPPDFIAYLQTLNPDQLRALFAPYQQEQSVLDQQMQMAGDMRKPGPEHSSPLGAALGGLSSAIGNIGGAYQQQKALGGMTALGQRQQQDAATRLLDYLRRQPGQMGAAVGLPAMDLTHA